MLQKKTLQVYWNDARSRRELLEEHIDTISQPTQQASDIQAILEAEWRDKVRKLHDIERIQVNFQSITLDSTESSEDDNRDPPKDGRNHIQELVIRLDPEAFRELNSKLSTRRRAS